MWGGAGAVCRTAGISVESSVLLPTVRSCALIPIHRAGYTTRTVGGRDGTSGTLIPGGGLYRYTAFLSGHGYMRLFINEERQSGVSPVLLDEAPLAAAERIMTRVFRLGGDVTGVSFEARLQGYSALRIHHFRLEALPD